ncbi:MAG: hypothetical protein H0X31_06660 [Nostocaceae cyanobacterium]|nr:hypothetical protein [Nostocaceae cyanobacterium]
MQRRLIFIPLLLLSLIIVTLWWPLHDSDCNAAPFLASTAAKYEVQATKVVVQPWRGEHHVYAIFIVPDQYKASPFFVLTIKNAVSACEYPFGNSQYIEGIAAQPGTHLIKDYIRTRLALRLILQGFYQDLRLRQNWSLIYPQDQQIKL